MNRVVYVGSNGNIFTIDPDGSNTKRLTDNVQAGSRGVIMGQALQPNSLFYTWPTLTQDGTRLAVSQVVISNGLPEVSLFALDTSSGQMDLIHKNTEQTSPIIAQNVPHYMYWSPDSQNLAFIASSEQGLTLYIYRYGKETLTFSDLGPLYFKWSGDSQSLVIHARDKLILSKLPFSEPHIDLGPMNPIFRTPDASPDGTTIMYLSKNAERFGLFMRGNQKQDRPSLISEMGRSAALIRSPSGDLIAVADSRSEPHRLHDQLRLFSSNGEEVRTLIQEPFLSFFWSPDGKKIAYVGFTVDGQALEWKIVSVDGGDPWKLTQFKPSPEFLAMLSFYDQYALSHSIWSPDSTEIVFAGTPVTPSTSTNGNSPNLNKIFIINTNPGSKPNEIAGGTLAFWSWN